MNTEGKSHIPDIRVEFELNPKLHQMAKAKSLNPKESFSIILHTRAIEFYRQDSFACSEKFNKA